MFRVLSGGAPPHKSNMVWYKTFPSQLRVINQRDFPAVEFLSPEKYSPPPLPLSRMQSFQNESLGIEQDRPHLLGFYQSVFSEIFFALPTRQVLPTCKVSTSSVHPLLGYKILVFREFRLKTGIGRSNRIQSSSILFNPDRSRSPGIESPIPDPRGSKRIESDSIPKNAVT